MQLWGFIANETLNGFYVECKVDASMANILDKLLTVSNDLLEKKDNWGGRERIIISSTVAFLWGRIVQ